MDAAEPLRVFLLDDHEVVRQGLKALLESEADLVVVGEASTAREALARVPALRPDVAVLDVRLPDGDGITVCRDLRSALPHLSCLMLTSFGQRMFLAEKTVKNYVSSVLSKLGLVRRTQAAVLVTERRTGDHTGDLQP
jgi:two-component system response regulator DevR